MTKGVDIWDALPVILPEPTRPLTAEEIDQWVQLILESIATVVIAQASREDITEKLQKLLSRISELLETKRNLNTDIEKLENIIKNLKWEIPILQETARWWEAKLKDLKSKAFKVKVDALWGKVVNGIAILGITWGISGWLYMQNTISDPEQYALNLRVEWLRAEILTTFTRLWIITDEVYQIAGISLDRSNKNIAFSERDFLEEDDFYQLEWEYQGYKLILAILFSAPENVMIWLWEVKTELTTPSVLDIETFISEEFQRQEVLRVQKEQEEAEKQAEAVEQARIIEEEKIRQQEDLNLQNRTIVETRKQEVISTIGTLTNTENYIFGEPIVFRYHRDGQELEVILYPEKKPREFLDDTYWLWESEIVFNSEIPYNGLKIWDESITKVLLKISVSNADEFTFSIDWSNNRKKDYTVTFWLEDLDTFNRDLWIELFSYQNPLEIIEEKPSLKAE